MYSLGNRLMLRIAEIVICVFTFFTAVSLAKTVEEKFFPVNHSMMVTEYYYEGGDLILTGKIKKDKSCKYLPPPRAFDDMGNPLLVVSSSTTGQTTYPAADLPFVFGPWRVIGGENRNIIFYQEFQCHPFWNVVNKVGEFNGRQ